MPINTAVLKKVCEAFGPSGHECQVREVILEDLKGCYDDYQVDVLGNLIVHKKGDGPKIMLAGHMDEIGFIVTYIEDEGFIRFSNIGGFDPFMLVSRRVIFANGVQGVIRSERLENFRTELSQSKLYIDIGAPNKEHVEKLVKVGDVAVYSASFYADEYKVMTPALDDRVGCFIMMETLKQLKNPKFDCYFVFTTQEEVGLRGAKTSVYTVDPDYGLAFDVTGAFDTPKALKYSMKMGGGACIKIKDASVICHKAMIDFLTKVAVDNNIKYQYEILDMGGTDTGAIHVHKSGVISGCISVSSRYIHGDAEMCAQSDIEDCINLTVKALETGI
ncbi:MAG: M42 family metallopeptidase [Defluviitaleaceae bacterium]|nr:M42 family metallopeptidase [Defluviitaleaceae bacterium]MCL2835415.1 M42 family metallopeptidase [Defluviitaleaceae bacterium]